MLHTDHLCLCFYFAIGLIYLLRITYYELLIVLQAINPGIVGPELFREVARAIAVNACYLGLLHCVLKNRQ